MRHTLYRVSRGMTPRASTVRGIAVEHPLYVVPNPRLPLVLLLSQRLNGERMRRTLCGVSRGMTPHASADHGGAVEHPIYPVYFVPNPHLLLTFENIWFDEPEDLIAFDHIGRFHLHFFAWFNGVHKDNVNIEL